MRMFSFILLLVMILMLPGGVCSAPEVSSEGEQINISSDRLEADENNRTVTFYGNVQARKANMVIYADTMTLLYGTDASQKVDRVEIDGRLRIVQDDRIATADHGVFHNSAGRILLSGNAEVHQGGNSVVGDEIEYYLDEARSVVKSQPDSRVNAVFNTGGKQ